MKSEMVSIVMPCFNASGTLTRAIRSVQDQSHSNWELIIVDDASTDESAALARSLAAQDKRIKVLVQTKNHGRPAFARNRGIREAKGPYLAFLDADDWWLPQKLQHQLEFMKETQCPLSFTQYRRVAEESGAIGRLIDVPKSVSFEELLKHNVIGCSTAMVNLRKTGPLELSESHRDDFIIWLNILKKGHCALGIKEDLVRYLRRKSSMSGNRLTAAQRTWALYRKSMNFGLLKSLHLFLNYVARAGFKHLRF